MTAPSWSINRRAVAAIARHATSPAECRELLDMLGVLDDEGRIKPDDTAVHVLPDVGKAPSAQNPDAQSPRAFADHGRRPPGMTTPPGLAVLPPLVEPRVFKPSYGPRRRDRPCLDEEKARYRKEMAAQRAAQRPIPECGQYKAYSRHRRLGEPIDEACHRAQLAYQKAHSQKRRDAAKAKAAAAPTETDRLIGLGVNPEMAAYLGAKNQPTELEASA